MASLTFNAASEDGGMVSAVYPSAVGVDVHAETLVCAFQRYEFESSSIQTEMAQFGTSRTELRNFAQWVASKQASKVVMESTGVLWRAPYEALEDSGIEREVLVLVNARDVKGKKGHKTDKNDACHLAEMARMDAVRPSFVPSRDVRDMRLTSRAYIRAKNDLSRWKNRYNKLLNSLGSRAGSVFSDVHGKTARAILDALINHPEDLDAVIERKARRLKASGEEIRDALAPIKNPQMQEVIRLAQRQIVHCEATCEQLMNLLKSQQAKYEEFIQKLMEIPNLKEVTARLVFAEIGPDLSSFGSIDRFASWAGLCPGIYESAGKRKNGTRSLKGNKYLRWALVEHANGIALTKRGYLREVFQILKERRGRKRAIIALAHKVLRIIYALFKGFCRYRENPNQVLKNHRVERLAKAVRQAAREKLAIVGDCIIDQDTGEIGAVVSG